MLIEFYWYIFGAILAVISIIFVIICIVRDKSASRQTLVFFTSLEGAAAMLCFGGNVILSLFGMGWRCTPFNIMLNLCFILFIPMLVCGINELLSLEDTNPAVIRCGVISMSLALIVIPISTWLYFQCTSLSDSFTDDGQTIPFTTEYNGQTILYATNSHGSYGYIWRYYLPINDLVHGVEITQDGWHGVRPWERTS